MVLQYDIWAGGSITGAATVGVTSVQLVRPRFNRKKITFVNDAANAIYLSKNSPAVLNAGIRLNASGGAYIDEPDEQGFLYRGAWYAISSVAAQNLCWVEDF